MDSKSGDKQDPAFLFAHIIYPHPNYYRIILFASFRSDRYISGRVKISERGLRARGGELS